MRKYRGERVDNGEWVKGYYIHRGFKDWIEVTMEGRATPDQYGLSCGIVLEVIPETVGQYTGLPDKNGKEICEGDIVKGNSGWCESVPDIVIVEYEEFANMNSEGIGFSFWEKDKLEIIGNIYDNPKLLKVKDDKAESKDI